MKRTGKAGASFYAQTIGTIAAFLLILMAGCRPSGAPASVSSSTLRVGFGLTTGQNPQGGIRQVITNVSVETLVSIARDGRPQPRLVEKWTLSPDSKTVLLHLRPNVTFQDGTPLSASLVRDIVTKQLPGQMGPAIEDVAAIRVSPASENDLEIILKRPSRLLLENLELAVQKPGTQLGTGPFYSDGPIGERVVLRRHDNYHGGQPLLSEMAISEYGSIRAAWADLLRGEVDMLYDVGADALSSLESSTSVAVFTFPRPYQYVIVLNTRRPKLQSAAIRRALNAGVDRTAIVREAMSGRGTEAVGPIQLTHWAFRNDYPVVRFDPKLAASTFKASNLQITCLVPTDATFERMTLMIKRQLESVGVQFSAREASIDELGTALKTGDFDAVLLDVLMPTMARAYRWWHSQGTLNLGFNSKTVDEALDKIRHATGDEEYRAGVEAFQRAIVEDPPAIFLAWSERARAVSTRFEVPVEEGRDILSTLRLWRPIGSNASVDTN